MKKFNFYKTVVEILQQTSNAEEVMGLLKRHYGASKGATSDFNIAVQTLESLLDEHWVMGKLNKKNKRITVSTEEETDFLHFNRDEEPGS